MLLKYLLNYCYVFNKNYGGLEITSSLIKNMDSLLNPKYSEEIISMRRIILDILEKGIFAANPQEAILRNVSYDENKITFSDETIIDLSKISRIFIVGAGKASAAMASALESILSEKIQSGYINVPENQNLDLLNLKKTKANIAGHPYVSKGSIEGTKKILDLINGLTASDLVFCLISGGGSALLEHSFDGITLNDLNLLFSELSRVGATIHELNTIRKHISQIKGGKLAQLAQPAQVISLIISDVIGDDLDTIASGPTAPDNSTWKNAEEIISKYNLHGNIPKSIVKIINDGLKGKIEDTPKSTNPVFKNVKNMIIASNELSCKAMKEYAKNIGFQSKIVTTSLSGEAKAIGKELVQKIRELNSKSILIMGGETTVTIQGDGKGGRNQELVLASSKEIGKEKGIVVAAIGSDGIDGPTDAAGGIADSTIATKGFELDLDIDKYLEHNDSYNYLKKTNGLIYTGPTGTNVMDLVIAAKMND